MQPPVRDAGNHRLARQLGAVQEEQQRHRHMGDIIENHGALAVAWEQLAATTVAIIASVKLSGKKRGRFII
jgi:hypothetical protein